jgi:hypothetical protein
MAETGSPAPQIGWLIMRLGERAIGIGGGCMRRDPFDRQPNRPIRRGATSLLALAMLLGVATPIAAQGTPLGDERDLTDVIPAWRDEVEADTEGALSRYQIEAGFDTEAGTIAGTMTVEYVNASPDPLDDVYFRLYPNASYYAGGELAISDVQVESTLVEPVLEVGDTALRVPLLDPVAAGASVEIALSFTTVVPLDAEGSYGIFDRDGASGTWTLADWHPVLAVYEPDAGWKIDPPTRFGDPTYAASSLFDVRLTAPAGWEVVTSGTTIEERPAGEATERHYLAGPAREFTMVADDDFARGSVVVGETTIHSWFEPSLAAAGESALNVAAQALEFYSAKNGTHPFEELDLVQTPLAGALGVAWAGIAFLDGPTLYSDYATAAPETFTTIVAHEVAHLWWGAQVGVDSNDHAFMNESLATLDALDFVRATYGEDAGLRSLETGIVASARSLLAIGDTVVDLPYRDNQDPYERSLAVYGKGALGFLAIREAIGQEAYDAALRAYVDEWSFDIAEPADLRAAFEEASGADLAELWRSWFEAEDLSEEAIATAIAGF